MKNIINIIIALSVSILIGQVNAQPVLPSANAGSFGKYVDQPVSHFTGTSSVNVPIASVSDGPLSAGVAINYHTGGSRVAELAGPVGLGWALMAGGAITRTVRSIPDERLNSADGYWHKGDELTTYSTHVEEVADGDRDGEPDIFAYNFGGYVGKFFFDDNNDVHMVPKSDILIDPKFGLYGDIDGFIVKTPDGTVYYFGYCGQTWQSYSNNTSTETMKVESSDNQTITWNLERIESFDKKHEINFTYQRDYYRYYVWPECQIYSAKVGGTTYTEESCDLDEGDEIEILMVASLIGEIETSVDTIEFFYNDRSDLDDHPNYSQEPQKLYKIEIGDGSSCVRFDLTQSYFLYGFGIGYENQRLKLDQIRKRHCTETPDNTNSEQPWIFEYNGSFFPNYLSKRIDHWGYYNGASDNDDLDDLVASNSCYDSLCFGDADRDTDEIEMIKGSLKKVTYPTKGSVSFEYEANTYAETSSASQTILDFKSCDGFGTCCDTKTDEEYYTLTQEMIDYGSYDLIFTRFGNTGCYYGTTYHIGGVEIYDQTDGGTLVHSKGFNLNDPGPGIDNVTMDIDTISGLVAGHNYKFKLISVDGQVRFHLKYAPGYENKLCGGLRVSKTTIHDGISTSNDIIREFDYNLFATPGKSSGILSGVPTYAYEAYEQSGITTVVYNSTSIKPLSTLEGYHIAYENVTVDHNGNGSERYQFEKETPSSDSDYPTAPPSAKVYHGNLSKHQVYNSSATELSSKTITRNSTDSYTNAPGLVYRAVKVRARKIGLPAWEDRYVYNLYENRTSIYRPSKIVSLLDGVTSTEDIYYESTVVYSPTKTEFTNSDGKETEVKTYYTGDYSGGLNDVFEEYHMIGIPYKTEKYVDSNLLDGSETEYSNFDTWGSKLSTTNTSDFPRPYKQKRYERTWTNGTLQSGSWNTKMTFLQYRSNGLIYKKQKEGWWETHYDYYSNKLLKHKIHGVFWTDYEYYTGSNLVKKITNPDDTYTTYTYDELRRLDTVTQNCDTTLTTYTYYNTSNLSTTKNYIETETDYQSPSNLSDVDVITSRVYQDGLGRDIQTVLVEHGPSGEDIVNAVAYDKFGRLSKTYETQSNASGNGAYVTPGSWDYTLSEYYDSPLNRLEKVTPLGSLSAVEYSYGANVSSEVKIDGGATYYAADLLSKLTVKDGNGNKSIQYKDKLGRTILSRKTNSTETSSKNLDTYTLYDDKSRVIKVLPPGVSTSQTELYFEYEYDGEDHVVEKKVPGADVVYFKYNSRDLLAAYQDGYLRNLSKWYTYTVDSYGRERYSGYYSGTPTTNFTPTEKLTENIYGTSGFEIDKVTSVKTKILGTSNDWLTSNITYDDCARVESTSGNSHMNLGTSNALQTTSVFDGAGNVVQTTTDIIYNGTTTIIGKSNLDEVGRVEKEYFKVGSLERIISENEYNYKNQLVSQKQGQTGNGQTGYREYAQKIDYSYRQDGLLEKINDNTLTGTQVTLASCTSLNPGTPGITNYDDKDLFYSILHYDNPIGSATSQENGNISNMEWQIRGRYAQMYAYEYDEYNRLTEADYYDYTGSAWSNTGIFDTDYTYDSRGNFTDLNREGKKTNGSCYSDVTIDDLSYNYYSNSNELEYVNDNGENSYGFKETTTATGSYTYDTNGNMITDSEKGFTSIVYNHLNLPVTVTKSAQSIEFTYDAGGNLLNKKHKNGPIVVEDRDYVAGIEYVGGTMDAIYHSEGRVKYISGSPRFEYYIRDHLGNNRILYCDLNADGLITYNFTNGVSTDDELLEETHYYPYGMAMDGPWMSVGSMDYGYNGVEYEDFMGLDMNLATYRGLDPALGRWCQVDPKAEAARGYSPYTSMHDNPIRYTDPNGDFIPAAILGAGVGLITNGISNLAQGNSFFQGGLKAAAFGALGGASSFGIGQIFGKSGNFGHELLRAGAHGFSSGIQSELAGGSFGSGILGGAIASGIGSGIGVSGLKGDALVSAQIAGGGIGGGIGSSLAGGRFMSGFSNGLLVGGLNHVAHSGALGENFAAALVTGRVRHILGPDAIHFTAGFEIGLAPLFDIKFGKLLVLRGKYAGSLKNLWEFGVGGGLEMGVGVGDTKLYYSGSSKLISPETFTGFRIQGVVSGSIGIEVGKSISFSRINKKDFVLGIGNSIGVGLGVLPGEIGVGLSGNITYGYSFFPTY